MSRDKSVGLLTHLNVRLTHTVLVAVARTGTTA